LDKSVSFTGHRPNKLGGYNENNPIMRKVKRDLDDLIGRAIKAEYFTFISGMALGVDIIAAEIVLKYKSKDERVKLIAAVPFEGQEGNWSTQSQERWKRVIEQADDIVHVCEPGYAAWKMQKRNQWMVDNSSVVIAVWDGTKGGTGNCVNYAKKAKHQPKVIRIIPESDAV
jgi:uncharacterized phage-like protein YoqJ